MIEKNIRKRKSIVCFDSKPIPDNVLYSILEAAGLAPSSNNQQPWRFIVGQKGDSTYDLIYQSLTEGNKVWASRAPVLIVSVAEVINKDRNSNNKYAWHDTAMAYSNMVYQATANDLYFHPMGGFSSDIIRETFNIPGEFEPVIAAALGYHGNCSGLSSALQQRDQNQNSKNPVQKYVYHETWGDPFYKL